MRKNEWTAVPGNGKQRTVQHCLHVPFDFVMNSEFVRIFVLILLVGPGSGAEAATFGLDERWLSHYRGDIEAETEMLYLDNFSIQLMKDSNLIGYILIYSGADSCPGEAQARALRMKNYMMEVRGVAWDRVMWRHAGRYRGKGVEVFHLGIPRLQLAKTNFPYEPAERGHVMPQCRDSRNRSGGMRRG